ncbi:chemotaxis protein CheW [Ralstonia sp. UBA689]|uniref:chemotaxis protein CheW n=1 Tax=Ralstonia sp. UBA689 TaxID=1947373 RepID=UPI0025DDEE41|nr:chemotaxis protein CheW [Ralstonia sp. UBA689]
MNEPRTNLTSRQRLHEYQAMLARRLQEARAKASTDSFLGVQIGEHHWMLSLSDTGEVLDYQPPARVPLTQPWYLGLVNARGNLLGVIDFGLFCGEAPAAGGVGSKIVVLSKDPQRACAIVVPRVAGLRSVADLQPVEAAQDESHPWQGRAWRDAQGTLWRELDVRQLLADPAFLQVGRSRA